MPNHILTATDVGTRVRIDAGAGPDVNIEVGDTGQTWPTGSFIEIVRLPGTLANVKIVSSVGATLNQMSGTLDLNSGEYARASYLGGSDWDIHIYKIPAAAQPGASAALNEVVIGTGTGIGSNSAFSYLQSENSLYVNFPPVQNDNAQVVLRSGATSNADGFSELKLGVVTGTNASNVEITAGSSANAGNIILTAGTGQTSGGINLQAGMSTGQDQDGGNVRINAGASTSTLGLDGGSVIILAGDSFSTSTFGAAGGGINLTCGASNDETGPGGSIRLNGGTANGANGRGGDIEFTAGFGAGANSNGGDVSIYAGASSTGTAGSIFFFAGETVRLGLDQSGAVSFNNVAGEVGQVLTSGGALAPPTWQSVSVATPIYKPSPLVVTPLATNSDFGSSAHHNVSFRISSATAVTITVQPDSFFTGTQEYWENNFNPTTPGPMPIGGNAVFGKVGAGDVVFAAGVGVTINTPDTLIISKQHGKATLIKVGPNEYDLEGNIG